MIVANLKDKIRYHGSQKVNRDNAVLSFWNQRQAKLKTLAATADAASSLAVPIVTLYSIATMHTFHLTPSLLENSSGNNHNHISSISP